MENGKIIYSKIKQPAGFTIIELLVVVSIIGILSSITTLAINPALLLQKTRDTKRKEDLRVIAQYLNFYQQKYYTLPEGSHNRCQTDEGLQCSDDRSVNDGRPGYDYSWLKQLVTGQVAPVVPKDPNLPNGGGPPDYAYRNVKNGYYEYWKNQILQSSWCWTYKEGHFVLQAGLENTKDPACVVDENGQYFDWRGYQPPRCLYFLQDGTPMKNLRRDAAACPEINLCHPI